MQKKYFIEISQDYDQASLNRINKKRKYLIYKNRVDIRINSINKKIRILKNKISYCNEKLKLCSKNYKIDRNNLTKINIVFMGRAINYIAKKTSVKNNSSKKVLYDEFVEDVSIIDQESEKIKSRIVKREVVETKAIKDYYKLKKELEMYKYRLTVLKYYKKLLNQRILKINNEEKESNHQLDDISTQFLYNNNEEKACAKVKIKYKK